MKVTVSIIRAMMMEAVITSETVNFYQNTRRDTQENSHLPTHRRENLKSHLISSQFQLS
jgi:hypothetical protein